jgi:GTP-binding protein
MMKPTVAIVGRPNVGKSTLFNRLSGLRKAIVDDHPGVTRDRNIAPVFWRDREFLLIDTGGFEPEAKEGLAARVRDQVRLAREEADLILFLVSARDGLNPLDEEISRILRRDWRKSVFLVVNKADSPQQEKESVEFLGLGLPDHFLISAEQGRGLGELLDAVYDHLPLSKEEGNQDRVHKIAVVGRPNVGKSSLLNRILGSERVIVSDQPGTTRDAIDTPFCHHGRCYLLVDTAGIRRPSKVSQSWERYSVMRAIRALGRSDFALILLDATAGITVQDNKITALAEEKGCSSLLLVNKWDLVPRSAHSERDFELDIRRKMRYLDYTPVLFISALTGRGVERIFPEIERMMEEREKRVGTHLLNRVLQEAVESHQVPASGGQPIRILYGTQFGISPPTFVFFANRPEGIQPSYRRYLSNRLREAFGFRGAPIRLIFRKR